MVEAGDLPRAPRMMCSTSRTPGREPFIEDVRVTALVGGDCLTSSANPTVSRPG
jgi:hypothetical protein